MMEFIINTVVPAMMYVVPAVAILTLVMHFGTGIINDPKGLLKTLGAVVAILVVFFIVYSISSGEVPTWMKEAKYAGWSDHSVMGFDFKKLLGAGIFGSILLMVIGIILAVVMELVNLVK